MNVSKSLFAGIISKVIERTYNVEAFCSCLRRTRETTLVNALYKY